MQNKKFRVSVTEVVYYESIVIEAKDKHDALENYISMLDKGDVEPNETERLKENVETINV